MNTPKHPKETDNCPQDARIAVLEEKVEKGATERKDIQEQLQEMCILLTKINTFLENAISFCKIMIVPVALIVLGILLEKIKF